MHSVISNIPCTLLLPQRVVHGSEAMTLPWSLLDAEFQATARPAESESAF